MHCIGHAPTQCRGSNVESRETHTFHRPSGWTPEGCRWRGRLPTQPLGKMPLKVLQGDVRDHRNGDVRTSFTTCHLRPGRLRGRRVKAHGIIDYGAMGWIVGLPFRYLRRGD